MARGQHTVHWSFEDPTRFEGAEEQKLAKFREGRDLIEKKIREWVEEQQVILRPYVDDL